LAEEFAEMALSKVELQDLYRRRAGAYDFSANLYYLIGFRETRYRKTAISGLNLKPGDTVVEIGCGTGLNFTYLLRTIGRTGRLIGVDLTDSMLEKAADRVKKQGWKNVNLIRSDAAAYVFPQNINGVLSTFAITLVPEYQAVIEKSSQALADGGRLVVLDFKLPENWPRWLVRIFVMLTKPFGVSLDLADRRPWETMEKCFSRVTVSEIYGGLVYIAVGEKRTVE
jgi:ubiquinone/menaquinone biosynthesis C-methylase UbiE